MIKGQNAYYSYGFYGVTKDFKIYELLSGKEVDRFISQNGMSEREEILHNVFKSQRNANHFSEIESAHKKLYYVLISRQDKYLLSLAQKAIKRWKKKFLTL